jgi:hypothetical protein
LQVKISEWQFFIHYILWQSLLCFNSETSVIVYQHVSYFSVREEKEQGDSCPVNSVQLSRKSLLNSKGFRFSVTRRKRVEKMEKNYPLRNQNTVFIIGRNKRHVNIIQYWYFAINYWWVVLLLCLYW